MNLVNAIDSFANGGIPTAKINNHLLGILPAKPHNAIQCNNNCFLHTEGREQQSLALTVSAIQSSSQRG